MYVDSKSKVPEGEHFAIVEFGSVFVPGDERSRTHPGHGYPEHYESTVTYVAFTDRAEWEAEIARRTNNKWFKKEFVAIVAKPVKISTTVSVNIS